MQLLQRLGNSNVSEPINVALNFREVIVALPQSEGDDLVLKAKILDDFLHGDDASLASTQQRALYVDFLKRHKHIDRKKDRDAFQLALRSDPYFNALRLRFGYAIRDALLQLVMECLANESAQEAPDRHGSTLFEAI